MCRDYVRRYAVVVRWRGIFAVVDAVAGVLVLPCLSSLSWILDVTEGQAENTPSDTVATTAFTKR